MSIDGVGDVFIHMMSGADAPAVRLDGVSLAFDEHVVLRDVSFGVPRGSMTILLGASGAGKSVLLKLILGLLRPDAGSIEVHGKRIDRMKERDLLDVRGTIGMLFQENALFDSLTVAENVGYRLTEETDTPEEAVSTRVREVLGFVGLADYSERMPSELSGGQRRRVAIARAMAAKPPLVLFDDPTTGLDPMTATTVSDQVVKLRDLEEVTSIVVTHQMRDALYLATHRAEQVAGRVRVVSAPEVEEKTTFMMLYEGRIYFEGSASALLASNDGYIKEFLFKTLPPW